MSEADGSVEVCWTYGGSVHVVSHSINFLSHCPNCELELSHHSTKSWSASASRSSYERGYKSVLRGICNVMFLLYRTTVCKVETTSCRLVKLICEVWALSRWQQCCDSLAAMFAWWLLGLLSPHLQTIRCVHAYSLLSLHLMYSYKVLKAGENCNLGGCGRGWMACLVWFGG